MTFFITNDSEHHFIKLIRCFEKRPTVNEQLLTIEKQLKITMDQHIRYNRQIPYAVFKNLHLFDNQNTDNFFYIININKFEYEITFEKEMSIFMHYAKKYLKDVKIVYAPSCFLLQNYLLTDNCKSSNNIEISSVSLIKYFKKTLSILENTKKCIIKSEIPFIILPDLIHELTKIKYLHLLKF